MKGFIGEMIMTDTVEKIGKGSVIQHGKHNDRIYLMKLHKDDVEFLLDKITDLAFKNNYAKVFCKVPKYLSPRFIANGYILEAHIPRFYNNKEDLFFLSKFLNSDRFLNIEKEQLSELSNLLEYPVKSGKPAKMASGYSMRKLDKSDVSKITHIYKQVFESYPFPIHDESYIVKTMKENVQYVGIEKGNKLVAIASSEIDWHGKNAEMTDFATHPKYLGKKLSVKLLELMENEMKKQDISTLYTIARLNSIPMNKTFLRCHYMYSGTLIKNTNISGKIESMNVYYKHL